jgi:hypothetical protein
LRMMTLSRHSLRKEEITLSQYGFCQGDFGAIRTSSIFMALTFRLK